MKKLILILLSAIMFSGISMAQNKPRVIDGKKVKPRTEADNSQAAPAAPATKLKKDGTPDMRHKDNKAAKSEPAPAGPVKKDGTPDKRYKANKSATSPAQK